MINVKVDNIDENGSGRNWVKILKKSKKLMIKSFTFTKNSAIVCIRANIKSLTF